jgi:carbon monoxide dehydrogenase subunit G
VADHFGASVIVDRPIAEVFAFLADGTNDVKFSKRIVEIERKGEGPIDIGTVYASVANDVGFKQKHEFELTRFEEPTMIRWKELTRPPVYVTEGGYDLVPTGESSTEVSFFNQLEGRGVGKLFAGFAVKSARKGADEFVAAIKRAIEES